MEDFVFLGSTKFDQLARRSPSSPPHAEDKIAHRWCAYAGGNMLHVAHASRRCTPHLVKSPGGKPRPSASAFHQIDNLLGMPARSDDAIDAPFDCLAHGVKLAKHAADRVRTFFLLCQAEHTIHVLDQWQEFRSAVVAQVHQTGDAGQQDEQIGGPEYRDTGGEFVIVAV